MAVDQSTTEQNSVRVSEAASAQVHIAGSLLHCPRGKNTTPPPAALASAIALSTAAVALRPMPGCCAATLKTFDGHAFGALMLIVERQGVDGLMNVHSFSSVPTPPLPRNASS